jgi:hypothetical protein
MPLVQTEIVRNGISEGPMMVEAPQDAQRVIERASALAAALDAEDYATARGLIADACVYEAPRGQVTGAESIVASYADAGAWAKRTFSEVRYESRVEPVAEAIVAVEFIDYLLAGGFGWHRYRCRQEFTFGAGDRVVRIVHRELPGEREELNAYLARCGLEA